MTAGEKLWAMVAAVLTLAFLIGTLGAWAAGLTAILRWLWAGGMTCA